jgi:hypothetical protein
MRLDLSKSNALLVLGAVAALSACAGAPAPPPPPPAPSAAAPPAKPTAAPAVKDPLETGNACVKGESTCEGGECVLSIKNACDQAVSCDATMTTTCRADMEMIEAARRKRVTFAAKTDGEIRLVGDCARGAILRTAMKSIACK